MAKHVTVSARIPIEVKEDIEKYDIQTSEVIRKALEAEIKQRKIGEIKTKLNSVGDELAKINLDETANFIREEREKR
ncbi:CopG family transcriptional regulator [Candidatus Bathyarchaeota archaeon]|nr:CopG family transcriptional regulator [Candidatus Bathyarchaeota archaeon]